MHETLQSNSQLWTEDAAVTGIFFSLGLFHMLLRWKVDTWRMGHGGFNFQRFINLVTIPGGKVRPGKLDQIEYIAIRKQFFRFSRVFMVYLVEQGAKAYPKDLDTRWRPVGWFQDKANADDLAQEIGYFIGVAVKRL